MFNSLLGSVLKAQRRVLRHGLGTGTGVRAGGAVEWCRCCHEVCKGVEWCWGSNPTLLGRDSQEHLAFSEAAAGLGGLRGQPKSANPSPMQSIRMPTLCPSPHKKRKVPRCLSVARCFWSCDSERQLKAKFTCILDVNVENPPLSHTVWKVSFQTKGNALFNLKENTGIGLHSLLGVNV